MGALEFSLKHLKMHKKVTKRMHLTFYLMTFTLKYEHVSAVQSPPVTHLHLKLKLKVHLRLQLSCT